MDIFFQAPNWTPLWLRFRLSSAFCCGGAGLYLQGLLQGGGEGPILKPLERDSRISEPSTALMYGWGGLQKWSESPVKGAAPPKSAESGVNMKGTKPG